MATDPPGPGPDGSCADPRAVLSLHATMETAPPWMAGEGSSCDDEDGECSLLISQTNTWPHMTRFYNPPWGRVLFIKSLHESSTNFINLHLHEEVGLLELGTSSLLELGTDTQTLGGIDSARPLCL